MPKVKLGTSPSTRIRQSTAPLNMHEIQQIAYHVAAAVTGDPVKSPKRLAAAGQTVHDVRTLLKHGRGNVHADRDPSNGHNGVGSSVAEQGMDSLQKLAYAAVMGAGVCDRHAGLSAIMHAPYMTDDDKVVNTGARVSLHELDDNHTSIRTESGHCWNELRRISSGRKGSSTVVMDAWANGPAVRLKDSAWKNAKPNRETLSLDSEGAAHLKNRVEVLVPYVHPSEDDFVASRMERSRKQPTKWEDFVEAQIVSKDFAENTRTALSSLSPSQQQELVAMVARQTYGLSEHDASNPQLIASVLEQANRLDQQERPPVVPPDF